MSLTGIENGRAAFAFQAVERFVSRHREKENKEYRSYIKKMPMMIKTNGLGQTLAFYYSQESQAYQAVYKDLGDYLKQHKERIGLTDDQSRMELVEMVIQLSSRDYRFLTTELLSLLNWMRRFVEGQVEGAGGVSDGE